MAAANIEAQLAQLQQRKAKLEEELRDVEKQVFNLETSYLNDSAAHGNVLRGFEGFLGPAKPQKTNRARNFKTEERLFSLSSTTSPAVEELAAEREAERLAAANPRKANVAR